MPSQSRSKWRPLFLLGTGIVVFVVGMVVLVAPPRFLWADVTGAESSKTTSDIDQRVIDNVAFGVSERLEFEVKYGFISAGTAALEVAEIIEHAGRPVYRIVSTAQSNSFFSSFYKVEDTVESLVDQAGLFSWKFRKRLREGGFSADVSYTFDQRQNFVYYKKDTIAMPPFVQDALSVMYYTRTQDLKPGTSIYVDNFTDGKLYPLEIRVLKRESITVAAGTFNCLVVEPLLQGAGVFKHEGKLTVWITDDRLKMPVLMKSRVLVGAISAELTGYRFGDLDAY